MRNLKIKRSTKQYITVALISVVIVGTAALIAYLVTTNQMRDQYEAKLTAANLEMESNKRNVYIAKEDIMAGGLITEENAEYKSTYASQSQDTYIDSNDIGKTALVDIPKGTHITKQIITDENIEGNLRETTYSVITISGNVKNNDTVDIRLVYPNGENYVVLSKKRIMKKDATNDDGTTQEQNTINQECYFWLNEEEILRMSSAIVDAYLYEGTQIYTTEYIEPNLQSESIVNYTPSLAAIDLIKKDPNIVNVASKYLSNIVRKELENRLAASLKTDVEGISWDTDRNTPDAEIEENNNDNESYSSENIYYFEDEKQAKKEDTEYGE